MVTTDVLFLYCAWSLCHSVLLYFAKLFSQGSHEILKKCSLAFLEFHWHEEKFPWPFLVFCDEFFDKMKWKSWHFSDENQDLFYFTIIVPWVSLASWWNQNVSWLSFVTLFFSMFCLTFQSSGNSDSNELNKMNPFEQKFRVLKYVGIRIWILFSLWARTLPLPENKIDDLSTNIKVVVATFKCGRSIKFIKFRLRPLFKLAAMPLIIIGF